MLLRIELDKETASALVASAVRNLRQIDMEAYWLLRKALQLPVPFTTVPEQEWEEREAAQCTQ
jgi:hypothetical protein